MKSTETGSIRSSISSFNVAVPSELDDSEEEDGPYDTARDSRSVAAEVEETINFWNSSPVELDPEHEPWRAAVRRNGSD